jgi:ABC-type multidrug transport system permease subunit
MYHPGIDAIASLISLYPVKLLGVSLFNIILYFLSGLKREAGAFFTFMLFTYTMVLIMASMFRVIGAVNKHEAIATSVGGVFLLPLIVYTGCKFCSAVEGRGTLLMVDRYHTETVYASLVQMDYLC